MFTGCFYLFFLVNLNSNTRETSLKIQLVNDTLTET